MNFTDDEIIIEPGHLCHSFQTCNYTAHGEHLFHERTYHTKLYGKGGLLWRLLGANTQAERDAIAAEPDAVSCWLPGLAPKTEIEALAARHGGYAHEQHYPDNERIPLYFLAFDNTDKALAFCRTDDFDRLCLTMEKATA